MKEMSKVFFNSVEEMNECYGVDAELPSNLQNNADLVCYEIVEQFTYEEVCQYKFDKDKLKYFSFGVWSNNLNNIDNEIMLNKHDIDIYEGRCFVYVRVNDYLRKRLEKTLIGCEFIHFSNKAETPYREFVHSVDAITSGIMVTNQDGLPCYLSNQLFYPNDYSDPIPYKEWVKKINEQGDED
ncbi:MAG: hypothetical protein RR623_00295 [Bacilli bacterium]